MVPEFVAAVNLPALSDPGELVNSTRTRLSSLTLSTEMRGMQSIRKAELHVKSDCVRLCRLD